MENGQVGGRKQQAGDQSYQGSHQHGDCLPGPHIAKSAVGFLTKLIQATDFYCYLEILLLDTFSLTEETHFTYLTQMSSQPRACPSKVPDGQKVASEQDLEWLGTVSILLTNTCCRQEITLLGAYFISA